MRGARLTNLVSSSEMNRFLQWYFTYQDETGEVIIGKPEQYLECGPVERECVARWFACAVCEADVYGKTIGEILAQWESEDLILD